ncbi:MAG: choice-of-anchor D domain-containing protein [Verrucomicrobiaceae bacterium]
MKTRLQSRLTDLALSLFSLSLLAAVFTACQHDPGSFTIDTPGSFANLTTLTDISGSWDSGSEEGSLTAVKLTLMRSSDNKFWNGTSWGNSFDLPTTVGSGTWSIAPGTNLPSGADLQPDYYLIEAYADFTLEPSTHNVMFTVGVPAPPVLPSPWAWGSNGDGRLGVGNLPGGSTPIPVFMRGALEGKIVTGMAAGGSHTLALSSEGRLYSWGNDDSGQLGSSDPLDNFGSLLPFTGTPVKVDDTGVLSGKEMASMAAGDQHSLAVSSNGLVFAWGDDQHGQLGRGTSGVGVHSDLPVAVSGLLVGKHVKAVSAGLSHSVALTDTGELFAWGHNSSGQLGDGTSAVERTTPVAVTGLSGIVITAVDCGYTHNLAVTNDGKLYAWGAGANGRLGNGGTADSNVPLLISGPWGTRKIIAVSAGAAHSLAVDEDGKVYAWGENIKGQLGLGDLAQRLTPVQVTGVLVGQDIHRVEAGAEHSFAQTHDNKVFTWGGNDSGQLARSTAPDDFSHTPQEAVLTAALSGGRVILGLSAGDYHVEMLTGFTPNPDPEIEVEAQGVALVDGSGPGINFGAQSYGNSVPVWVTVRNVGHSDLTDLEAWVDGPDGIDYWTIFTSPPLGSTDPGNTTGFYIFFQPFGNANPAPTTHNAVLHIASNDADENTFDIALTGTGYPAGKPESGFNAGLDGHVIATALQPDGKILLGGSFWNAQPTGSPSPVPRFRILRLNADGTLDPAFNPNASSWVHAIAVQRDGKILVGGEFMSLQPGGGANPTFTRKRLARLNADGTVDESFNTAINDQDPNNGVIRCILPLPDGKILIGGNFTQINDGSGAVTRNFIARLNSDGSLDTDFNPGTNGEVFTMAVDAENKILLGGYFTAAGGATRYRLARVDMQGALDGDLNLPVNGDVHALAVEKNGAVLVGGNFASVGGVSAPNLARIKPDDTMDTDFMPAPNERVYGLGVQADGSIIACGIFTALQPSGEPAPTTRNHVARLFPGGSLDFSFDPNVTGNTVNGVVIQPDGKIIIGGQFSNVGGQPLNHLARLDGNKVTSVLTVPSLSYLTWERGGGTPETSDVWFDLSTDSGSTWTTLTGTVSRSPSGWQQTGISLPATGHIRARARISSGGFNGSSSIVEKITVFGEPPDMLVLKDSIPVSFGYSHEFGVVGTGSASGGVIFTIQNNGGGPLTGLSNRSLSGSSHFSIVGPAGGTVPAGGSTTITVLFQPRTVGIHSAILHLPSNDPDLPLFDILLSGTGSLPVPTWRQQNFGQTENTGSAADTAAPTGDGITNLEKYARGLDPNVSTTRQDTFTLSDGGGASEAPPAPVILYNYTRSRLSLADVTFQVEWSDTLAPNDWHSDGVTEQVQGEIDGIQQVQATVPAGNTTNRYVRLKMTRQ